MNDQPATHVRWGAFIGGLIACLLLAHGSTHAGEIEPATPQAVGLLPDKLAVITARLHADIERKLIPGAVLLIARQGKEAYFEAVGSQHPAAQVPMARDSIFRIESMTKPITTVAAMMLIEEGRLSLDDALAKHLPAYAGIKVVVDNIRSSGPLELREAQRSITVRDLLRHTAGLDYDWLARGTQRSRLLADALRSIRRDPSNEEFTDAVAKVPLAADPGTMWSYSYATDVLGRVIEVVSGKSLAAFMKERIFEPLDMKDTAFHLVQPPQQSRLAEPFEQERGPGPGGAMNDPRVARRFEAGGQGLVSTARDYARFAQMLLNGGELDGKRLLRAETVAQMTTDQSAGLARNLSYTPGDAYGFGFGFAVRTQGGNVLPRGELGDYHWGGAGGTYFWVDPKHRMVVVLMMQSVRQRLPYRMLMRELVYDAVVR